MHRTGASRAGGLGPSYFASPLVGEAGECSDPPPYPPHKLALGRAQARPGWGQDQTLHSRQNNRVAARNAGNKSPSNDGGQATASAQWNTT